AVLVLDTFPTDYALYDQYLGPNWAVLILPQMEQDNLYKQVQASINAYLRGLNDQNWRAIRKNVIQTYLCPSDSYAYANNSLGFGQRARGSYAANAGPGDYLKTRGGGSPTHPEGQNRQAGGVMCINWGARLSQLTIEDGASNTIMVNHVRAGPLNT